MLLTFASADDVYADYVSVLVWGVIVVVGTIVILGAANKGSPSEVKTSTAIKIGCFAYLLLAVAAYRETCGSFIAADIGADAATLHFAGALYPSITLKREQIREVLSGFPGRGTPHSCYLKFITTSGETYRSAPTPGTACKDRLMQVNTEMKLPD
ncbi:MAG: hypothetical protein KKH12_02390 [Gammaproteobacteria bacterium]|nr:hypothetical protein [Gammaproteobacteria bacterium]MBU1480502.1 hypothetical protein [Gammaproteobacteria bacterium]